MELSSEDQLRLNVLVAQPLYAVRVDESKMRVQALSEKGEANVQLNPTCKDEKYIRIVRQFLSTHYLGSPGGYPVFIRRWARMGQARDDSLEKLLLIGEPEAVVAVVHAAGLTNELARRAWWSSVNADNARQMLNKEDVVNGDMGAELAQFLIEFLPFEEHQKSIIDSVRLVLQPGLINDEMRKEIWSGGRRKNSYYVGFLQQTPNDLPIIIEPHEKWERLSKQLKAEINNGNEFAKLLCQSMSPNGQAFMLTSELVLNKPNDQDVVVELLNAVGAYFKNNLTINTNWREIESLTKYANEIYIKNNDNVEKILAIDATLRPQLVAMMILSMTSETLVNPIFGMTDAIGTVMRKKIEPVVKPLIECLHLLQSQ